MLIICCYITDYSQNSLKIITSIFFFSLFLWTKSLGLTLLGHCDHHCGPGSLMSNSLSIKTAVAWSFPRSGESVSRQLSHTAVNLSAGCLQGMSASFYVAYYRMAWMLSRFGFPKRKLHKTPSWKLQHFSRSVWKHSAESPPSHSLCHTVLLWLTAAGGSTRCNYQAARMTEDQSWVPLSKRKKSAW